MTKTHHAACSCGQLTATCTGDPVRVSVCHCLACQRRTGAPFAQQARWAAASVTLAGDAVTYVRTADSGGKATFRFCPHCGATVCFDVERLPGFLAVPVGAFADPTFPAPVISFYEARKHGWVTVPEAIEHVD